MRITRRGFLIHATSAGVVLGLATRCSGGRPKMGWPENPFLQGNFAPADEEITADNLTVIGKLPPELDGMYVRNGPNPQFPRINDALIGQRSRFGYRGRTGRAMFDGLIKYDLNKGTSEHHQHGGQRMGGEGVFVPRPDPAGEDDGWLVTYVHDNASGTSKMVVVETRDFRSPPVARVIVPARVPYGFHGTWISSTQLAQQR